MSAKNITLAELSRMVDGELHGDPDIAIHGLANLATAVAGEIAFLVKAAGIETLKNSHGAAFIVPHTLTYDGKPLIKVANPYLAAAIIQNFFQAKPFQPTGISPKAHIGSDCYIPAEISIGPFVSIGDRVKLGKRVSMHSGVVIGDDAVIGDDCLLYPNVTVYHSCTIGSGVIIHGGTVIGSDGFGFATDENGNNVKWPHIGTVQIDDNVEIGANVTIDRGTFGKTHIMRGVKIDNLVQIGHNVKIGGNSIIVAQVGIAGSASLGKNVVLGGQSAIKGHIHLDDGSMVAGKSGVHSNVPKGAIVSGIPAIPHKDWLKASIIFAKLPKIYGELRDMQKKIVKIYEKIFPNEGQD
ncbi:MAG: UDP-3-O-(3-hydroxymyristoyl)glucosamine N-acyltransferase [Desulfobacterales bacterium]|jgi:UDP-3-O-[3-hydroxymyristoyl] glucosamine N-acyltransferase